MAKCERPLAKYRRNISGYENKRRIHKHNAKSLLSLFTLH